MANNYRVINKCCRRVIPLPRLKKSYCYPSVQEGLQVPSELVKMNNCVPVLYGSAELLVPYRLTCGQNSTLLYEADNLDCLPTITLSNTIFGRPNPCTSILVFNIGNGTTLEKELPKNLQPSTGTYGPVFTVGNVKSLYVRCNSDGTDGCEGSVSLTLSYCGVNNCL